MNRTVYLAGCFFLVLTTVSFPQTKPGPAGHWEGSITIPTGVLKIVVDLDKDAKGVWIGDIDIPEQGVKDFTLRALAITNDSVSFDLTTDPNGPKFQGKMSEDGNTIAGNFTQGGGSFPLSMKRAGEAKVYVQPKNALLPDRFAGKWEGSLDAAGSTLRLVFNLGNKEDSAIGTIDSLDQSAMGIPMDEISVTENAIKISVKVVAGNYSGKLSDDGMVLTGEWSQAGNTLPLVLKKAAAAK